MADVDLSVAVTSTGVQQAIAELERLREKGLTTGQAMRTLAGESERATRAIASGASSVSGTTRTYQGATAAIQHMTTALQAQQAAYRQYASLRVGATPAERLAGAFGGDLASGVRAAKLMRAQQEAFNADPVKDLIEVERQQLDLTNARARAITATGNLARAQWERELAAMTPVEAAKQRLIRATQELATATRLNNLATQRATADPTTLNFQRQEQAATRAAAAVRGYTSAKQGLISAQERENRAHEAHSDNAFQSSYSYFILAGLATGLSTAITGVATASITATAQIERSFADVERTFEGTDAQLASLQNRLFELSTETPISFIDLSEIATLGNQLGVAAEDIENFTTVIAQYTAVSGQSAEDAATAFGRISNLTGLTAAEYGNLASAITYVARTTVATESTIQNTAKEITALASGAGFSADAIVGLAGALSSLAIPPERARGALSLYFGALNSAVAEGGPKLAAFAELTNLTAETLNRMVRENRGQEVFTAFISGLSELDTVAKTTALDTLGLSTIRVDQTMRALAQNVPLVTQSFEGANRAFEENIEIANQYAIIQGTLDSKWKQFQNAVQNAAGELGESFIPVARAALEALTGLLVGASAIADTPLGRAFATMASGAALLIAAIASLVGVLSLAQASFVVFTFAVRQLGWTSATAGLRGWLAALVSTDKATRAAALMPQVVSASGMSDATLGARALTVAMNVLKVALPILAISAAIALVTELATAIDKAVNPSKRLTDDLSGLKDALLIDNREALAREVAETGQAAVRANPQVSDFNQAILQAIQVQRMAEGAFNNTNEAIDVQSIRIGEATRAWIAEALKTQEGLRDIIEGRGFWEEVGDRIRGAFTGDYTADEDVSRDDLERFILGGLDLNELSQIAITQGRDAAEAAYDAWAKGFNEANPELPVGDIDKAILFDDVIDSVIDAYGKAAVEAALAGVEIGRSGEVAVGAASDFDELGNYIGDAVDKGEALVVTFSGVTARLDDFRDAIQGAISGSVGFDSVLDRAKDSAQAVADALGDDVEPRAVDASMFGKALQEATNEALKFYKDLNALAADGNQSFALQLAELGPEAQGILSSALSLDSEGQQKLEAAARFAAFLASDAFKNTLQAEMADSNEAYARILLGGGSLGDVQSYIAAQVAGVGEEWERQWAIDHPDLPLNVTPNLVNPTPEDLQYYSDLLSGAITVKPTVTGFEYAGGAPTFGNTYTDTATGASITLPANLDGAALSASLDYWRNNQNATPEEIAADLNTDGFNRDVDAWRNANGPITVYARVVPTSVAPLPGSSGLLGYIARKDGGEIPKFANGGGWGMFRGPGSGISDSLLARVSAGEYINTADSTRFWGPDFFDALNRKMLPTTFLNMLSAAAVSGNRGPTHVANVTVVQQNPVTRDPLKQLREKSEMIAAGVWE